MTEQERERTAAVEEPLRAERDGGGADAGSGGLGGSGGSEAAPPAEPAGARRSGSGGKDARVARMGTEPVGRLIAEFAIPSVVGMLVNGSYNLIDSMFLGHAVGEIGLSAVTVANPIMIVFMALAMLIGNGGNALAALRLGQGKREAA